MTHRRTPKPGSASSFKLKPLLLSALVGLIPVISGMLILYWQVDRSLMRDSVAAGQRAILHIDRTLERADDLTARAGALAGQECTVILEQMRRMVVGYPSVRSMVMGNTEKFYCGSELGAIDSPLSPELASVTKLLLRAGSLPTPDRPSLMFRRYEGSNTVNAVIDAQVVGENLAYASNGADVMLENNGLYIDASSQLITYDFASHADYHAVQTSSLYGYRIHSGMAPDKALHAFKAQALPIFGTLLLLGVMTAGVCHWLSCRPRGPRER